MENLISNFITAFRAEHIKIKGRGIYLLSAILGMISPIIFFIVAMIRASDEIKDALPYNHYLDFIKGNLTPFVYFFFPLLIIMTASRITQLDHKNGGWKLMETQPVQKLSIYFSKFSVVLIANLISILFLVVFGILFAWILTISINLPDAATTDFPFVDLIQIITRVFVASLLVTALQYVISVLISSFIWSIVIGFLALLLTLFTSPFNITLDWNPYQILANISAYKNGSDLGYWFIFTEYVGVICSVMLLYVGFQWYKFKNIRLAFLHKTSKLVKLVLVIGVSAGLLYYVLTPNQMPDYKSTILSGRIESDMDFKNVYLIDKITEDTVIVIPINNGYFHHQFKKDVLLDYYSLALDDKIRSTIFFGKGDSIFVESRFFNKTVEFIIKGTRLAENQMRSRGEKGWSSISYNLEHNNTLEKVDEFSKNLYEEWEEKNDKEIAFRTVDNYIPKSDFSERRKKLLAITYLNYWSEFSRKRKALYPNEKTNETPEIENLKSKVSLVDESLLSSKEYFKYVSLQLTKDNTQDIDANTKSIEAISKLPKGTFKDKMLYKQMIKSLNEASNTGERNDLVAQYNDQFSNIKYRGKVARNKLVIENLSKGNAAPYFEGVTLDGGKVSLSDLTGKYVIIDVWATWCGPCVLQSPHFEKYALKYKKENIHFMALSIDKRKDNWFIDAKSKSKTVLQLLATDSPLFEKDYSVRSIPRFILIDPKGDFVNSKMPFPSETSFEILLRKALNLPDEV